MICLPSTIRSLVVTLLLGTIVNGCADEGALMLSPALLDIGAVHSGETVECQLTLANRSKRAIEIANVTGSCSCQSFVLDNWKLEAGESTALTVAIRGESRPGPLALGVIVNPVEGAACSSTVLLTNEHALKFSNGQTGVFDVVWGSMHSLPCDVALDRNVKDANLRMQVGTVVSIASVNVGMERSDPPIDGFRQLQVVLQIDGRVSCGEYWDSIEVVRDGRVVERLPVAVRVSGTVQCTPSSFHAGLGDLGSDEVFPLRIAVDGAVSGAAIASNLVGCPISVVVDGVGITSLNVGARRVECGVPQLMRGKLELTIRGHEGKTLVIPISWYESK